MLVPRPGNFSCLPTINGRAFSRVESLLTGRVGLGRVRLGRFRSGPVVYAGPVNERPSKCVVKYENGRNKYVPWYEL